MLLQLCGLTVALQNETILSDLSLSVQKGEFLALLGPSGCGKSTLLKSIAGIVPLQQGQVILDGQDITRTPVHKRGTVILFQEMRLFPNMTVLENVAFPLKMQGIGKTQRLKQAEAFLQQVQMGNYSRRRVYELSGGQQQRVALARALAAQPRVLLLDEPFSALDENLRGEMRALVTQLHRSLGMTTVLVTHDRAEALSMADRVAVMFGGQIAQTGTPQEVYDHPVNRRVADYFGDCVYLSGQISDHLFCCEQLPFAVPAPSLPDGRYEMMLRCSALHPEQEGDFAVQVQDIQFQGAQTAVTFCHHSLTFQKTFERCPDWKVGDRLCCKLDCSGAVFFSQD